MKKTISKVIALFCLYLILSQTSVMAQCTWEVQYIEGYENQNINPYLVAGTTVHNIPQTFAVHGGTYSLYLNFINCVGSTGTCAGAKVFEQPFVVCPGMPVRLSTYLATSFSGTQCNVRITITDANGTMLNDQPAISAPYSPSWYQYTSGSVTPVTDTIYFTMYTNVGGGNGNDLSMDDMLLEKCSGGLNSTTTGAVCDNLSSQNLFDLLPGTNDTTGTWSGAGTLTNGYLGTYNTSTGIPGNYIYQYYPYATNASCPLAYDTVAVTVAAAPAINLGIDTTLCTTATLLLTAGTFPGATYLWNNGVTGPNTLAFTSSTVNVTNTYFVQVTNANGCIGRDTIAISFIVCSGIDDANATGNISLAPNPSNGNATLHFNDANHTYTTLTVYNALGSLIQKIQIPHHSTSVSVNQNPGGMYFLVLESENQKPVVLKLVEN
ncbi:MAG: T9SS type A sorting domain-containing protein [Bacteroidetes bacterium]|nr:T9SS type A sorting domain-containing protein [Bacteroidota bacterium]